MAATPAWTGLAPAAQSALWNPATVALPDRNGTTINWRVAPDATMVPAYFTVGNGAKHEWMKWGSVKLTEDFGDYEWIIRHPDQPQPVTYYRSRLDDVAAARAALRTALGGPGQYVLAMNDDPAPGDVGLFELANIDAASAQITFELTDPGRTKQALLEGMTSGLERRNIPDRATLAPADADVRAVVSTAARRLVRAGLTGADADLLMAYIIGDLCHKVATALPGPGWAAPIAANFKQWRTLFPKSHPVQILYQALKGLPDTDALGRVATALAAERAQVAQDVLNLVARKIGTMRNEWSNFAVPPAPPTPQDQNLLHAVVGTLPLGITVPGAIQAYLDQFQPNFIETEYDRTRAALTDMTMVAQDVVRSTGFAQHPGYSRGFAFEDRAEVATDFPGLATTYDRIKALVARF